MNAAHNGQDANRVLPEQESASYCGVPLSTWRKMRRRGETPPAIQLSPRRRGYTMGSLIEWQRNRRTDNAERLVGELDYPLRSYAEWRRYKAAQYPDDTRNVKAAEMAERIANTLQDVPRDVLLRLEPHVEWDGCDSCTLFDEAEESIKTLGFHWGARSGTDFIEGMIPEDIVKTGGA